MVNIFGNPEQSVQIAHSSFALLDVWFDKVARGACPFDARIALVQFRGDEFAHVDTHDLAVEAFYQFIEQLTASKDEPCLQQCGADGHVGLGLTQTLGHGTRRVADLLAEIPQQIKHRLHDALAPGRLLVGQQKQQVDV